MSRSKNILNNMPKILDKVKKDARSQPIESISDGHIGFSNIMTSTELIKGTNLVEKIDKIPTRDSKLKKILTEYSHDTVVVVAFDGGTPVGWGAMREDNLFMLALEPSYRGHRLIGKMEDMLYRHRQGLNIRK